ncbi:MAG: hypothetical protein R6U88_07535 [Candidatus Bipolaricaulota bacterium]
MRYPRVPAAVLALLICTGSLGSPAVTPEPLELGLKLAELTMAVGEATSLPEAYQAFGSWILQSHTPERLLEDLAKGRELAHKWLGDVPEDTPWRDRLADTLEAVTQAEAELKLLPSGRLSDLAQEELAVSMDALHEVEKALEMLDTEIKASLLSEKAHWVFQMAMLCGPLAEAPMVPPSLPEDDARFLAEEIPPELPQESHRAVRDLLKLLSEQADRQPPHWGSADEREAAKEVARTILVGLGVDEELEWAEEDD